MVTKLDRIDLQILKDLQNNGRLTNVELARRSGISAPPCLRRVRTLEQENIIKGYYAQINAEILGFGVTVFTQVTLTSQSDVDLRGFEAKVAEWPLVRECYVLAGDADFLLKVVAKDWDAYQKFYSTQLTTAENIVQVKSKLVIRNVKSNPGIPLEILMS